MRNYRIGLYEKAMPDDMPWQEKLTCAKECGYDYVEMSLDESDTRLARLDWTKEERRALCRAMEETGVPIRSICLSGHRKYPFGASDAAVRQRSLEIMEKSLALAEDLGIRMIQLAGYDVYYEKSTEDTRLHFLENLRKAAKMAAVHGVVMGFETMETEFMNTVEKSMVYVRAVGSPYLGVYPDVGNLTNAAVSYGRNVTDDLRLGAGRLFAVHLKPTKPGVFRDLFFDDPTQHVNFARVIAASWDLGVRRYVTELWNLGRPDWRENIQNTSRIVREILDRQQ